MTWPFGGPVNLLRFYITSSVAGKLQPRAEGSGDVAACAGPLGAGDALVYAQEAVRKDGIVAGTAAGLDRPWSIERESDRGFNVICPGDSKSLDA